MARWDASKHPRNPKTGRFVAKPRTPLPIGSGKGNKSFGIGKEGWPARVHVTAGPGSGPGGPGATVGGRVRYRSRRADVAVGVVADAGTLRKQIGRVTRRKR